MNSFLRIVVTGLIAQHPLLGGITWHYLQYVLGLARLGHDVYYFEDSGEYPYNFDGGESGNDWIAKNCEVNVGYLEKIMSRFGLENKWAYRFPLKSQWFGLSDRQRFSVLQSADILINVSGTLEYPQNYRAIPRLVYIDTDPMVTQLKIAIEESEFLKRVEAHDVHFSFGECFSKTMPKTEQQWRPTRQPIVLSEWETTIPPREVFTTVMNWTSYKPLIYSGQTYGQKDIEFKRFLELPGQVTPVTMEVAFSGIEHLEWQDQAKNIPLNIEKIIKNNVKKLTIQELLNFFDWQVVDSIKKCGDLDSYRQYIQSSKAEWSVAKNVYVLGQPGWFSERSACYLASGRPVVIQDTGLSKVFPVGEGILTFRNLEQAVAAIREVESNYHRHAKAAREIAEVYFDSDKVLSKLLNEAID